MTCSAVENPGAKINCSASRGDQPLFHGLPLELRGVKSRAVVFHHQQHFSFLMQGPQPDRPHRSFSGLSPDRGGLDSVVEGVADEVGERIADRLDNRLVEFDLLAFDLKLNLLAQLPAQVPHHSRELAEHIADRLHAGPHDRFLQVSRDLIDPAGNRLDRAEVSAAECLQKLIATKHEFTGQIHQPVEHRDGDADVGIGCMGLAVLVAVSMVPGRRGCAGRNGRHRGFGVPFVGKVRGGRRGNCRFALGRVSRCRHAGICRGRDRLGRGHNCLVGCLACGATCRSLGFSNPLDRNLKKCRQL